ncbi:hypothetical protein [Phytopseudomonas daroniae]|uniref:hypothetical protein n=1 Tax=Phytopseudomonas daroniae TaxID=2487519 RepID=UPI0010383199|nr:hypothetical protein [Pseudomonas daroniae]TBU75226.1 hypothetical protein DNK10_11265 [Pseudomonas daroniae]
MQSNVLPFNKVSVLIDARVTYSADTTAQSLEERTAPIYLTPEFASRLRNYNALVRDLRLAGVEIAGMEFPDHKIFIRPESAPVLGKAFEKRLRGIRHFDYARYRRHTVTIDGVDVVWFAKFEEPRV